MKSKIIIEGQNPIITKLQTTSWLKPAQKKCREETSSK